MDYTQIIVSVLSLIVAILTGVLVPYLKQKYGETKIAQTQQYVDIAVRAAEQLFKTEQAQEKNWGGLLDLVMELMEQAEKKFADGATRKEWVMAMVQTSAEYVQYPMDVQALSEMIDQLTNLTKNVNVKKETK